MYIYFCSILVENLIILNIVCGTFLVYIYLIGMLYINCVIDYCVYSLYDYMFYLFIVSSKVLKSSSCFVCGFFLVCDDCLGVDFLGN